MSLKDMSGLKGERLLRAFLRASENVLGDEFLILSGAKGCPDGWFKERLGMERPERFTEEAVKAVLDRCDELGIRYSVAFISRLRKRDMKRVWAKRRTERFGIDILGDEYDEKGRVKEEAWGAGSDVKESEGAEGKDRKGGG